MEDIYNIATKKFQGLSLTIDEQKTLESWLQADSNQSIYEDLHKVWKLTGKLEYAVSPNLDNEWESFKDLRNKRAFTKKRTLIYRVASVAASIILLIGIFGGIQILSNNSVEYYSENSEKSIQLPDGTQVWLNKKSTLVVSANFNKKDRSVSLSGEAFFDVHENPQKPFVIKTPDNIYTEVLGTSFNLRAYSEDNNVELQVVEGKVKFGEKNKNNIIVRKNSAVIINAATREISDTKSLNTNLLSWKTKEFSFDNSKLSEVILAFERYFDTKIYVPNNTNDLRFSGDFKNPSEEDFAEVLAIAFSWKYSVKKDNITFTSK